VSLLFSHPASLEHDTGAHAENAGRVLAITALLESLDWLGWERVESPAVDPEILELVHPSQYVAAIRDAARAASPERPVRLDPDTVLSPGSYRAGLHATGGAVEMVRQLVVEREHRVGFAIHRPPGHHAPADRAMGFCLFNHIAVAARYALDILGLDRVAIIDWDVHHGNGTQDIFWESDQVLFASIHQMPLYPGSGAADEIGAGPGLGLTLNLPVRPGSGDTAFIAAVAERIIPRVRQFTPGLVLVSAGFDAHIDDPLAGCAVTERGFAEMARQVKAIADEFGVPLGLVLEGGYDPAALARSVAGPMEVLGT
jgi:acetoin utilization deacetylase AcuC-like enzyme